MKVVCLICVVGTAIFLATAECKQSDDKKAKEKFDFYETNNYRHGEATIEDDSQPTVAEPTANDTSSEDLLHNKTCPICMARDQWKKYTLAIIKAKILAKLGMKHPPNITGPLPKIPDHILFEHSLQLGDEPDPYADDNFHARTEKVINFASKLPKFNSKSETGEQPELSSFYFNISQTLMNNHVVRAHLWIYVKPAEVVQDTLTSIHIYQRRKLDGIILKKLVRSRKIKLSPKGGHWEQFDFKYTVHEWVTDPDSNWGITVEATDHEGRSVVVTDTSDDKEERPFLEIRTQSRHTRKKRATVGMNCDEHTTDERCCRYPLTVDFEEFGWDWIIAPKMYEANYCAGDCPVNFLPQYPHTHLVEQADPSGTIGPCCTATRVSAITMLYFNDTQNIIYGKLPNMVVDTCGCS